MLTEEDKNFLRSKNIQEKAIVLIEKFELNTEDEDKLAKNYAAFAEEVKKTEDMFFIINAFQGATLLEERLYPTPEEERIYDIPKDRDLQPIDPEKWTNPSTEEVKEYCEKIRDMKDMAFGYWWNLRNSLMKIIDLKNEDYDYKMVTKYDQKDNVYVLRFSNIQKIWEQAFKMKHTQSNFKAFMRELELYNELFIEAVENKTDKEVVMVPMITEIRKLKFEM